MFCFFNFLVIEMSRREFQRLVAHLMWLIASLLVGEKLCISHLLLGKTLVKRTKKISREVLFIVVTLRPSNVVFLLKMKKECVLIYLLMFVIGKCCFGFLADYLLKWFEAN